MRVLHDSAPSLVPAAFTAARWVGTRVANGQGVTAMDESDRDSGKRIDTSFLAHIGHGGNSCRASGPAGGIACWDHQNDCADFIFGHLQNLHCRRHAKLVLHPVAVVAVERDNHLDCDVVFFDTISKVDVALWPEIDVPVWHLRSGQLPQSWRGRHLLEQASVMVVVKHRWKPRQWNLRQWTVLLAVWLVRNLVCPLWLPPSVQRCVKPAGR